MKNIAWLDKTHLIQQLTPYRITVTAGFIIATLLILLTPLQMPDPDDWAYYNGTINFSKGHFTIDNYTIMEQAGEIGQKGGFLIQYLPIKFNVWVLEKAPGVVFYLIPFQLIGLPRWSNVLLALGMIIVTFMLLKRLRDEKAAMIGSLLMLFTPISLVMFNRVYMDTYASLAFVVMGGGLYIYYHLERSNLSKVKGGALLFLAFFFIGWSVVVRYTNLPIAVIMLLHLVIVRFIIWRRKQEPRVIPEIIPLILGIGLPVLVILLYDYFVFGSPLKYGYSYSPYPIKFAFQYIGKVDAQGVSIPLQILWYNTQAYLRNFLIGFPLMIVGIPGFFVMLYFKLFKKQQPEGTWFGLRSELTCGILLIFIGWFVSVFVLYLGYEWTAGLQKGGGFVLFNRFLLPGLFPVVVICALVMARFPFKALIPAMALLVIYGSLMYAQWALNLHILPAWLTERTLDSRWPGYIFPPWTKAGLQFYKP